jgi:hypothetical protein
MSKDLTVKEEQIIEKIILTGDISGLQPQEKSKYYNMFCESLGLNPVTQPFDIINLQGKERLYAKRECTEQLRKINKVSIIEMRKEKSDSLYLVEVKVQDKDGRTDIATGVVSINNLKHDALANAIMKAESKAKRRATLSICGLGILDESEIETIPDVSLSTETESKLKEVGNDIGKLQPDNPPNLNQGDPLKKMNEMLEKNEDKKEFFIYDTTGKEGEIETFINFSDEADFLNQVKEKFNSFIALEYLLQKARPFGDKMNKAELDYFLDKRDQQKKRAEYDYNQFVIDLEYVDTIIKNIENAKDLKKEGVSTVNENDKSADDLKFGKLEGEEDNEEEKKDGKLGDKDLPKGCL